MNTRSARVTVVVLVAGILILSGIIVIRARVSPPHSRLLVPGSAKIVRENQRLPEPSVPQPTGSDQPPAVAGTVVDDLTSTKLTGVVIQAYNGHVAEGGLTFAAETESGGDGGYRLWLPPGRYTLLWFLSDPEMIPQEVVQLGSLAIQIEPNAPTLRKDLHCELVPKVTVTGLVVDRKTSLPIANAQVLIHRDPEEWEDRFNKPEVYGKLKAFFGVENLRTGEDGSFKATAMLYPGRYSVIVAHPRYHKYWGDEEHGDFKVVSSPGQRYTLTIRMDAEALATIKGRLVSRTGLPIVNAHVIIRNGSLETAVGTDQDGRFESEVNPDPVSVTVRHAEYRTLRQALGASSLQQTPSAVTDIGNLVLDRKELRASVTTIDESGAAISLSNLIVAEADLRTKGEVNPFFSTNTAADGSGGFYADPDLLYSFHLPGDSPWEILRASASENVTSKQLINYIFRDPESQIKIVLRKRQGS